MKNARKAAIFEPTGRGSHFFYVDALLRHLRSDSISTYVITSSDHEHPNYINRLRPLKHHRLFSVPLVGVLFRRLNRLYNISLNYIILLRLVKKHRFGLVHFQILHYLFLPLLAAGKRLLKFKIVYTPHNIQSHYRRKWIQNGINALCFRLFKGAVDFFIAHSRFHRDNLLRLGIPGEKVGVVPFAPHMVGTVDPTLRETNTILFAGSIRRNKGVGFFLDVLKRLDEELIQEDMADKVNVIIAGGVRDIKITSRIADMIEEARCLNIDFKNRYIEDREYHIIFNRATMLILPYSPDFRSLSAVLLDGYHYNNEIIATDVGANGEIIRRDESGWLVPPGDVEGMVHCIMAVLKKGPKEGFSQNRRRALKEYFNWEAIGRDTSEIYTAVLGDS